MLVLLSPMNQKGEVSFESCFPGANVRGDPIEVKVIPLLP